MAFCLKWISGLNYLLSSNFRWSLHDLISNGTKSTILLLTQFDILNWYILIMPGNHSGGEPVVDGSQQGSEKLLTEVAVDDRLGQQVNHWNNMMVWIQQMRIYVFCREYLTNSHQLSTRKIYEMDRSGPDSPVMDSFRLASIQ